MCAKDSNSDTERSEEMTVQELIDKLMKVEDKEREVTVFIEDLATFKPNVFDTGSGNVVIGD